jgi:hypothetical protein
METEVLQEQGKNLKEFTLDELAQILLTLDESELDTLELLLDPQARITIEQSLREIEQGATIPIEEW